MNISLQEFDVATVVRQAVDTIRPLALQNENSVSLHCSANVGVIRADLVKTRQLLADLLGSAAKSTLKGTIDVEVEQFSDVGRAVIIFAVDSSARTSDAQGADELASVSRVCSLMYGCVDVASRPDDRSRFTVCLPLDLT